MNRLRWTYLGRMQYAAALELQLRLRDAILAERCDDTVLLLEHTPVVTLGRSAHGGNVLVSADELARRGIDRVAIGRGGDVTYHGPGQLVGYPVRRVGRAIRAHVEGITRAVVELFASYGVDSWWRRETPGIWTARGKIAAIGVDARTRVATHGFACNIDPDMSHYQLIVPCGSSEPVTSLAAFGIEPLPTVAEAARQLIPRLASAFGAVPEEISPRSILEVAP